MNQKPKNIDDYIKAFPSDVQFRMKQIRELIHRVVPGAEESIRYSMPAFLINGQHIYFAGYKKHIGMYPMYGTPAIEKDLAPYRAKDTKDSIHFDHSKELPLALIEKIVRAKAGLS
jgi:uncharacterized protein YdhG (YjbR/CyaY superfamily)